MEAKGILSRRIRILSVLSVGKKDESPVQRIASSLVVIEWVVMVECRHFDYEEEGREFKLKFAAPCEEYNNCNGLVKRGRL